jgi:hypothetical protein
MIITGRARLRTSLTAPEINNAFKLRTKFGTREDGRMIRLDEPELALVVECPRESSSESEFFRTIFYTMVFFEICLPQL